MDKEFWSTEKKPADDKMWDVFISHASEDKEDFVRPLAEALQKLGVKVWYDEFELNIGSSLSKSIETGLRNSRYGIVVCSPAFFQKNWTDFELRSLLMRQIDDENVILPIWHKIDKNFIKEHSLYLLDIKAVSSDLPWNELLDNIMKVVRPDILNSHLLLEASAEIYKKTDEMPVANVPIEDIKISPVRHKTMPIHLIISTRLISEVFWDVMPMEYQKMVEDFARDMDYDREFVVWSAMANAYIAFIRETQCDFSDKEKKGELVSKLLNYSLSGELEKQEDLKTINEREYIYLIKLYVDNVNHIIKMIKRYN